MQPQLLLLAQGLQWLLLVVAAAAWPVAEIAECQAGPLALALLQLLLPL
jgi:hypothetical protein